MSENEALAKLRDVLHETREKYNQATYQCNIATAEAMSLMDASPLHKAARARVQLFVDLKEQAPPILDDIRHGLKQRIHENVVYYGVSAAQTLASNNETAIILFGGPELVQERNWLVTNIEAIDLIMSGWT